jgi:hypothetical protein
MPIITAGCNTACVAHDMPLDAFLLAALTTALTALIGASGIVKAYGFVHRAPTFHQSSRRIRAQS